MTETAEPFEQIRDYDRIAMAIRFIDEHYAEQPSLQDLADYLQLSPAHAQKMFRRWAGISPKQFLKATTHAHARNMLTDRSNVLDTSLEVGLSGPGRLHDLCLTLEAMSPGEVASGGAGILLDYGYSDSSFGTCLAFVSPRGLSALGFCDAGGEEELFADMSSAWPNAEFRRADQKISSLIKTIFVERSGDLRLWLKGTPFQLKVWRALLTIPAGRVSTYGEIAESIGHPKAVRAVGTAIGRNPVSWLIPCHRVLRSTGALGGYHWGITRKRAMLAHETAASLA